jgi:hypothetical protein
MEYIPAFIKNSLRDSLGDYLAEQLVSYYELRGSPDVQCYTFGTERSFSFTEPTYSNHVPIEITRILGEHTIHQPFVIEVPNVTLIGSQGIKRRSDGEFIVSNLDRPADKQKAKGLSGPAYDITHAAADCVWAFRDPPADIDSIELAIPLLDRWATNYSHWTEEYLTQLAGLEHYEEQTNEKPTILIPPDAPKFIRESLEFLGFTSNRYQIFDSNRIHVERLVLPSIRHFWSSTSEDYIRDPYAIQWIREAIFERLSLPAGSKKKLLISRQEDAHKRRITNWDEVKRTLDNRGFESVTLSNLDFVEQKRLFYNADIIVGTHGAGLTELIYARDASVLELFGSYVVPPYFEMSQAVGHSYGCVQCEPRGNDIYVDINTLCQAIDKLTDSQVT